MTRRLSFRACAISLLAFALTGCDSGSSSRPGVLKIGLMPKLVGIPYFNACRKGAEEAAKELGVEIVYDGPDTADSNRQVELLNSWMLRKLDVLAVAPNNPEAIAPVLERARKAGLRVLTWDTDSIDTAREFFCNQIDDAALARTLVDIVADELGGANGGKAAGKVAGKVAIVSGTETASNQNTWIAHMRDYMAEKHPGLEVLEPVEYPGEDRARSIQAAAGLLRRPERPDAIVGMTSVAAPAVAQAVSDAGLSGKVVVTGLTIPSAMRAFVKDGTVKSFVLWNPVDLGYLTIYAAKLLHDGKLVNGAIQAGRLGECEVRDGQVLLGDPLVFDASNIDEFDF